MADQVYSFQVTIPAGTPQASPVTVSLDMPPRHVDQIDVKVPPGPSGLMGFALFVKGGQAIPQPAGAYIVTDNKEYTWSPANIPDSGAWQVRGYNTDIYDHTIYIDFAVTAAQNVTGAESQIAVDATTALVLGIQGG